MAETSVPARAPRRTRADDPSQPASAGAGGGDVDGAARVPTLNRPTLDRRGLMVAAAVGVGAMACTQLPFPIPPIGGTPQPSPGGPGLPGAPDGPPVPPTVPPGTPPAPPLPP